MRRWLALAALVLCGAGTSMGAAAQTPAAEPYVDRVLDESPQAAETTEEVHAEEGWSRGGSAEVQSTQQRGILDSSNQSLRLNGYLDTPNYGTLSIDANLNRDRNPVMQTSSYGNGTPSFSSAYRNSNTVRIDQRGLPFDGGWIANNSLGDINTGATPMSRGLGRVYLPTLPIEGIGSVVERPGRTSYNASFGRLGFFDGLDSGGFSLGRGTVATAGLQQQLSGSDGNPLALNRTDLAFQAVEARNYNLNGVPNGAQTTRSFWTAMSWQGIAPWSDSLGPGYGNVSERPGGLRLQANIAHSETRPPNLQFLGAQDLANGVWVDAAWRTDWLQQGASVFRFDPGLRWGSNPIASDLQGVSWRGDVSTRQWQLGGSVELSESVSGQQGKSLFGNVFGRYRFDSRDALSATTAARTGMVEAQSLQVTWEHISGWGQSQFHADLAHGRDLQVVRAGVDHTWSMGESRTVATSFAVEQSTQSGQATRSVSWGVLGAMPLVAGARLDLNLRGSNAIGDAHGGRFVNANVRVSWPIGGNWSLVAQYSVARGQESLSPAVVSALTTATQSPMINMPSNRTMMIALRYDGHAGAASAPIGGSAGSGSGRLEGNVFCDQNNNGMREASESGVPNVTIVLDKRYSTRANAQGFYSFPEVAAGPHQVELVPDNLPLPWAPASREPRNVTVYVRSTVNVDFAVQQER